MPPTRLRRAVAAVATTLALSAGYAVNAAPSQAMTLNQYQNSVAGFVFAELNHERAVNHLPALRWNSALIRSSHYHNLWMARTNTMSHQINGEPSLGNRLVMKAYHWQTCGENVGWNTDRSRAGAVYLQKLMYNEQPPNDGHRLNILNASYREVGIDVVIDARTGKLWLSEDFGKR